MQNRLLLLTVTVASPVPIPHRLSLTTATHATSAAVRCNILSVKSFTSFPFDMETLTSGTDNGHTSQNTGRRGLVIRLLQAAMGHYPRLAAFRFSLQNTSSDYFLAESVVPALRAEVDIPDQVALFQTEVRHRFGVYALTRFTAGASTPLTLLKWVWRRTFYPVRWCCCLISPRVIPHGVTQVKEKKN
ncbi:hypothetical protein [Serratia fonticola]